MSKSRHRLPLFAVFGTSVLLGGCAYEVTGTGLDKTIRPGFDLALLTGKEISRTPLPGGNELVLRESNGEYSLKIDGAAKVIPIEFAESAQVAQVEQVKGRTLIVVQARERLCPNRTHIYDIQGRDGFHWVLPDCHTKRQITREGDKLNFDFHHPSFVYRYTYSDSALQPPVRMAYAPAERNTPQKASTPQSEALPPVDRKTAPAPRNAPASPATERNAAPTRQASNKVQVTKAPAGPQANELPKDLTFDGKTVKPVRISLD